jgi:tRNA uridine 5-carboxymethylaminomethyl modification enzyme
MCRPEIDYHRLAEIDTGRRALSPDVIEQVEIEIKYAGYIDRQRKQVAQFRKMENKTIPENIDYKDVQSLRTEARQKLEKFRPVSVGQASRIAGVSPSDIAVLLVYIEKFRRQKA